MVMGGDLICWSILASSGCQSNDGAAAVVVAVESVVESVVVAVVGVVPPLIQWHRKDLTWMKPRLL